MGWREGHLHAINRLLHAIHAIKSAFIGGYKHTSVKTQCPTNAQVATGVEGLPDTLTPPCEPAPTLARGARLTTPGADRSAPNRRAT